jgi:hypothetical protein
VRLRVFKKPLYELPGLLIKKLMHRKKGNRMKTLQQCKDEVSRKYGYASTTEAMSNPSMRDEAAELYASEAIREKDDAINRLKDRLEKAWQMGDIKPKELDLIMQLAAKDKEIEQLREALDMVNELVSRKKPTTH